MIDNILPLDQKDLDAISLFTPLTKLGEACYLHFNGPLLIVLIFCGPY
jgi:hypothetical protein